MGPEAGHGGAAPIAAVQMLAIKEGVAPLRSIRLMSFEPLLATTAMPVAGLMATSLGAEEAAEPTGILFITVGAAYVGWTARFVTANLVGSALLITATG